MARGVHPRAWDDRAAKPSVRALLQRATRGQVRVGGAVVGAIGEGLVILLGVGPDDTKAVADELARKAAELRVFRDADGRTNRSLLETGGAALVVSQFTLYADTRHGRRPGFTTAAPADLAEHLCQRFVDALTAAGVTVATGRFGHEMEVELVNDGPFTIWLDSADR